MTTNSEITRIPAIERQTRKGTYLEDVRGYNLSVEHIAKVAIIQHGSTCLGTGDTEEEALAEANRCGYEISESEIVRVAGEIMDGSVTVDGVVEGWLYEDIVYTTRTEAEIAAFGEEVAPVQDSQELREAGWRPVENYDSDDADSRMTRWILPSSGAEAMSYNADPIYREVDTAAWDELLESLS